MFCEEGYLKLQNGQNCQNIQNSENCEFLIEMKNPTKIKIFLKLKKIIFLK